LGTDYIYKVIYLQITFKIHLNKWQVAKSKFDRKKERKKKNLLASDTRDLSRLVGHTQTDIERQADRHRQTDRQTWT